MSTSRIAKGLLGTPERGPNGFYCCRWCKTEVMPPRRTFCSNECVYEHRLRTDPKFIRIVVEDRDQGVCAKCGIDTIEQYHSLCALSCKYKGNQALFEEKFLKPLKIPPHRLNGRRLYDIDHNTPVFAGGGVDDARGEPGAYLKNLVTVCISCHAKKTKKDMKKYHKGVKAKKTKNSKKVKP